MNDPKPFLSLLAVLALPFPARGEEPLDLRQAAARALAHAPEWVAAKAQGEETAAAARLAGDQFHPEAFLTTTPGYASGLSVAVAGHLPALASVEVRQTLLDPSRRSAAFAAEAREAAFRGTLGAARTRIALSVVRLYARVWLDGALLQAAGRRQEAGEAELAHAQALQDEGRVASLDLELAGLAVARAHQARLDAESERDLDALELAHLMGEASPLAPLPEDLGSVLPEPTNAGGLETARARDPELVAFGPALRAAEDARRESGRRFVPVVEADAQYSRLYHTPSYDQFYRTFKADDWSVGVFVAFPLFSGGRQRDAALQAQANRDRLFEERRQREFQLDIAFKRAAETEGRAIARASLARRAGGCAEEALRVSRARAEEGRGETNEIEKAAIALADARDDEARATAGELVARGELLALQGELLPALGIDVGAGGRP